MPLGDSITEGGPTGGYRRKFITENGRFLPVGSLSSDPPAAPFPATRIKHEGHAGFTSAQILSNIATYWTANPADNVLLHLGTNDALALTAAATTAANVAAIIDYIHAQSPATRIYLAGTINMTSSFTAENALVLAQRPLYREIATNRASFCKYVTMPTYTDGQLDGGPHPANAAAYDLMADAWTAGMVS
jgi:lysophospholipase L1-like esterase